MRVSAEPKRRVCTALEIWRNANERPPTDRYVFDVVRYPHRQANMQGGKAGVPLFYDEHLAEIYKQISCGVKDSFMMSRSEEVTEQQKEGEEEQASPYALTR